MNLPTAQRAVRLLPGATATAQELACKEWPVPTLRAGEVLVRNSVAGLNFIDVYFRTGLYPNPSGLLGAEGAGTVVRVADAADERFVGRRVAYCMASGAYSEYTAVSSARCVVIPDGTSMERAVAVMTHGLTAHYLTHDCTGAHRLGPDSWVLVHAAGSGTGNMVAQVASKVLRASVVGTASGGKLRDALERGRCKHVVDYSDKTDLAKRVRALTPAQAGFHVVFDGVGKDTYAHSLDALRVRGCLALFGNASGPVPPIDPLSLSSKGSLTVTRPTLAHFIADPAEYQRRCADVFDWERRGLLAVDVDREFPLEDVGAAHALLEGGGTKGKVLIRVAASL